MKLKKQNLNDDSVIKEGPPADMIGPFFQKFGDINVEKKSEFSCYLELQHVDWEVIEKLLQQK